MDWVEVGRSALWIAGLALVLAAFSRGHWLAGRWRLQSRTILRAPAYQMALDVGLLLVSVSLLLGTRSTWERLGWSALALLCTLLATLEWRRRRLPQQGDSTGQRFVATTPVVPRFVVATPVVPRFVVTTSVVPRFVVTTPVVPRFVVTTSVVPRWLATWVGRAELWWVLVALPFLLFPGRLAAWAVASLALLWVVRWITTGHLTARTPVDWPLLVLVWMLPVAVWASADLPMTLAALYRLIGGIALFYAVVNWASSWQRLVVATTLLVLIGVGLAALALLATTSWGSPKVFNAAPILGWLRTHVQAWIPEEINANVLAGGLALVWPVAAALLFARPGNSALQAALLRLAVGFSLLGMTAILLLTQSRGALLAVAVAVAVMAALRWPPLRLLLPLAGLALVLLVTRGGAGHWQRLADVLFSGGTITSLSGRLEVWSRAIYMIQDFAFTGIGLGTFDRVQPLLYPFFLTSGEVHHAHNLFLQVAVDLGLPGLVAYVALCMGSIYATWRVWQRSTVTSSLFSRLGRERPSSGDDRPDLWSSPASGLCQGQKQANGEATRPATCSLLAARCYSLGLLGGQTVLLVHGLLDATAWANKLAVIPWFMLGLAMAMENLTA